MLVQMVFSVLPDDLNLRHLHDIDYFYVFYRCFDWTFVVCTFVFLASI